LIAAGVPAVLAMQDQVPVNTAREFSRVFYRRLLAHGLVDLACNEARASLLTADLPGSAIPVLFSRLPDNRLIVPLESEQAVTLDLQSFEPETIFIPAGPFLMGSPTDAAAPEDEKPQHQVDLPAYRIGKFPVTNQQYLEYVRQTGAAAAPETGWKLARQGKVPDEAKLAHPVTGVSWDEALGYCHWLSQQTGRRYRLPTEAEWEKAARGVEDARPYPWGDAWDPARCNNESDDTTPVDRFGSQTPYGCFDMAGNVWEWTSTIWGSSRHDPDYRYPYQNDSREAPEAAARYREYRICRGGAYTDASDRLRCSARARYAADTRHKRRGFRVVMEAGEAR
jgi:formylglycine-generating enzyme required for sulfatase activity